MIIAGPDISLDRHYDYRGLLGHCDFFPTLMELLGMPVPESLGGCSYASILREGWPDEELVGLRTTITTA